MAAGVAVAAHRTQVQAVGVAGQVPARQFRAALQQEGVGADLEIVVAALAAFPFAGCAQPACAGLVRSGAEALALNILRLAQAVVQAVHEHLTDQPLVGEVGGDFGAVHRCGRSGRIRGRGRSRLRRFCRAQVRGLRIAAVSAATEQAVLVSAGHRTAVQRERSGRRGAAVSGIDHQDAAGRGQCALAAGIGDAHAGGSGCRAAVDDEAVRCGAVGSQHRLQAQRAAAAGVVTRGQRLAGAARGRGQVHQPAIGKHACQLIDASAGCLPSRRCRQSYPGMAVALDRTAGMVDHGAAAGANPQPVGATADPRAWRDRGATIR